MALAYNSLLGTLLLKHTQKILMKKNTYESTFLFFMAETVTSRKERITSSLFKPWQITKMHA
jgi:hypothetical protein